MFHRVTIIGNLGQDPEMRYTPQGVPVTSFSVAANRQWTSKEGETIKETVWFRVLAWRKLGEICNQYLSKGRMVFIEGRLTPEKETGAPRVWTGDDGKARASYEITATTIKFIGGGGGNGADMIVQDEPEPITEEEIPF